jgi:hypothetical protein
MSGFKPVTFKHGQVHVSGGMLAKSYPMTTMSIGVGAGQKTFVKLSTHDTWLLQSTSGQPKYNMSSFGRTSLVQLLHTYVQQGANGELAGQEAAADGEAAHDPMNEVEVSGDEGAKTAHSGRGKKRSRYYKNHAKNRIVEVEAPHHCPEMAPTSKETRKIKLFIVDRKQVWLDLDDVEWAMRFLYVQNLLKGVALVDPDSPGPGHGE